MNYELPFGAPYILKPSNSVAYWEHPFETQKKVYKLNTREELNQVIGQIYGAGYADSQIIQDFIPGTIPTCGFSRPILGRTGKVKPMCLGHALPEEHKPPRSGEPRRHHHRAEPGTDGEDKRLFRGDFHTRDSRILDIKYDERDKNSKSLRDQSAARTEQLLCDGRRLQPWLPISSRIIS
ncbi:MAG: hypothetical protein ACLR23_22100 [Clostridia bacterium]